MSEKVITNFEKDIYKKYYPLVFSNCKKRLYDSNSIEDAVQSTFLMYIREQESISSTLSSWLYWSSTSVCKVINKETKHKKNLPEHQNLPTSKKTEVQPFQEEETQIQLKTILDRLPKKKQEMLLMRFFDEMSYSQIALHFKSSEDGVRKMIEHTLNSLKEKLNKKDIVFSVLFAQFFQSKSGVENVISSTETKSQVFILQNTFKQQLIVKGVHKIILFSKLKMALVLCVGISLPISAILVADSKSNIEIVKENKNQNKQVSEGKDPNVPEAENKLLGTWTLKTKTKEWPHTIGTTLTIRKDGTFVIASITTDNSNLIVKPGSSPVGPISGKYTNKDSSFIFDFGPNTPKIDCTFTLEDKKLSFKKIHDAYVMIMDYVKAETK